MDDDHLYTGAVQKQIAGSPDKTQISDLLFYRGSSKNNEIKDFWFFRIGSRQYLYYSSGIFDIGLFQISAISYQISPAHCIIITQFLPFVQAGVQVVNCRLLPLFYIGNFKTART